MGLQPGTRLGPYEVLAPLGAGGMGEVYRARDTRLQREVAVKILPDAVSRDPQRLARFEREARSSSALNHRNIVTVHDFNSEDGRAWMVMELVKGEPLRALLSRGPLPLRQAAAIGAGIADGLAAAHAIGLVHRDLKPDNIMLTGDGTPKILDFGLVKQAASKQDHLSAHPTEEMVSHAGMVVGTAAYMSPEQARGEPVDFRTDHFSFGLILHEMLTGRHPFRRGTTVETLGAILGQDAEPLGDDVPEPWRWIVERCLAKGPDERYGSTADLAHDLARLRDRSGKVPSPARGPIRRAWWPLAVGVALLAAAGTVAVRALWRPSRTAAAAVQASVPTPGVDVLLAETAVPVSLSPDGRYLAVSGYTADSRASVWIHDLRTGARRRLEGSPFAPVFSPDSRSIAFIADGKLKIMPIEGGPARAVCDARPEGMPSWHGTTILLTQFSAEPGLYRVDAAGGTPERIVSNRSWWPQLLPDGRRYLYTTAVSRPDEIRLTLHLGYLDGQPPREVAVMRTRAHYVDGHLLYVRDGTLLAQPFDLDRATLTGEPTPLIDGLHYFRNTGLAAFSVSGNGVLAWREARRDSTLAWFDRGGRRLGVLATGTFEAGRFSPEGTRYAVSVVDRKQGVADLWIYDLRRESAQRITYRTLDEKAPVWSPDGGVLFYRSDGQGGPPDILRRAPGVDASEMVYQGPGVEEPQDVSSDGRYLLFTNFSPTGADVQILPLEPGASPRPFAATPFTERAPRLSPDMRWVAYSSDVSGQPEIYARPPDGPAAAVRVSREGGSWPRWSRDGKELYFLAPGGRLMSAAVGPADFGAPAPLFQQPEAVDFEAAPDGQRFLLRLEDRAGQADVHLLVNWPARLGGN